MAPGVVTWLYLLWILATRSFEWDGQWQVIRRLFPIQACVVVLGLAGGIAAFWLPSRALRIGVAAGSLFGAVLLHQTLGAVLFCP